MKLRLSKRKHIPLIYIDGYGEMYPWQWHIAMFGYFRKKRLTKIGIRFCNGSGLMEEWHEFEKNYLPPKNFNKNGLIVDVGARDGDTAVFYFAHGYRNMRLIEPGEEYHGLLEHNASVLRKQGCKIEVLKRGFSLSDLQGASFLKMDCEGCEHELDYTTLRIPYTIVIHRKAEADNGIYPYMKEIGIIKDDLSNSPR